MGTKKIAFTNLDKIVYSEEFRNLQDKTQLFNSYSKRKVRTRLTHTIEVTEIAYRIGEEIKKKYNDLHVDLNLIKCIALSHDIGHTPFGHIGERTIDDIFTKKDKLGGLIKDTDNRIRFKHNANSMRVLTLHKIDDLRILDGVLFHTRLFYREDSTNYNENPYDFLTNANGGAKNELYKLHKIFSCNKSSPILHSLTLEGQIVCIADEIAQRIADISDGIKMRHYEKIKTILGIKIEKNDRKKVEIEIFSNFIEDVVKQTIKNIRKSKVMEKKLSGFNHNIYDSIVVAFSEKMKQINDRLDKFVFELMTNSEEVRESDSRSKYIIRQLFKAYFNDFNLLPDEVLINFFNKITNTNAFIECEKNFSVFKLIKQQKWKINNEDLPQREIVLDFEKISDFFKIVKNNYNDIHISKIYDKFIFEIGIYIASLSNSDVFNSYNRIYGH